MKGVTTPDDAQAHITTFWSDVAAGYEAHAGNVAEPGSAEHRRWVDALASVLPDGPADVLDLATGTGYVALAAASLGHRVTAVDLAPAMLDEPAPRPRYAASPSTSVSVMRWRRRSRRPASTP